MVKVGFIGLGTMGVPMAHSISQAGYRMLVYNRSPGRASHFAKYLNVSAASSAREVAENCDIIITMLSNDETTENVYLGDKGIIQGIHSTQLAVDCSTISPKLGIYLAQQLAVSGAGMLHAPVLGSRLQAENKTLVFLVGGEKRHFVRCVPIFETMGSKAIYLGEHGSSYTFKLASNSLAAIHLNALSEIMGFLQKYSLDPGVFLEIISGGGAQSRMAEWKGPKMIARDFTAQFAMKLMKKDLTLFQDLTQTVDYHSPILDNTQRQFQRAVEAGYEDEDVCAIIKIYENQKV